MRYRKPTRFKDAALQQQAEAVAGIGRALRVAGEELYPGVPWREWTLPQWDAIFERGEELWRSWSRVCQCGHTMAESHLTPGTECSIVGCDCGMFREME